MSDSRAEALAPYFASVDRALTAAETDPRAANCRGALLDNGGKVIGVELVYVPIPTARYALLRVELIDEIAAQGNTVATCVVLDSNGVQTGETVFLAWPFPNLANTARPGNPDGKHMITNGYTPPALGPLALFVGDQFGKPVSDVIGGLGLPLNHHVCFRATWQERSAVVEPEPDPEPEPNADSFERMAVALERLVAHLGA